jgi:hypothetical protein
MAIVLTVTMSTYVINNRIPRFPIRSHYPDKSFLQKNLEDVFQVWLKERIISNLGRRKACSQLYDFSVWMTDQGMVMEASQPRIFLEWCRQGGFSPLSDWSDFLAYARRRVRDMEWDALEEEVP